MQACICKSTAKGQRSDYSPVFITCEMAFGGLGPAAGPCTRKIVMNWVNPTEGQLHTWRPEVLDAQAKTELGFFNLEQRLGVCPWSHGGYTENRFQFFIEMCRRLATDSGYSKGNGGCAERENSSRWEHADAGAEVWRTGGALQSSRIEPDKILNNLIWILNFLYLKTENEVVTCDL